MKVLHIVEATGGGVGLHVRQMVEAQLGQGVDARVAAPETRLARLGDEGYADVLRERGIDVLRLTMHPVPGHPVNLRAMKALNRILKRWAPDVIHSHSMAAGSVARPVAKARHIHSVHTPHGVRFADPRVGPAALAELIVERLLARATERVVALSPSERLILEKAYLAAQITVIPNALEATIEPVAPFPHPPRIVSVGRLEHEKSPEVVVQVFALVRRRRPDTEALIVGNGSRAARVESAIAKLDPAIRLVRAGLPGRDVIATATAVLVASRREGGPLVPLEAMERGRPVVATDVVGCRDVVRHGLTGYLAPLGDAHLLAHRLLDLIEDPVKAQAMGAVGRQVLLREYSLAASAEKLIRLYQAVVA